MSGALVGWLGGRAIWRHRSIERESQLRRAFAEVVALAEGVKALPPARDEGGSKEDPP